MTELPDQDDRDRAATHLDTSVFIEAGAGTGKSSTLVERIVNTIRQADPRVRIDQIAAITFTEKAGTELKHRVREGLQDKRREHPDDILLADAIRELDAAKVGTIHSFAQSILREHAISAGVPLGFTVADDAVAATQQSNRVREAVELISDTLDEETLAVLAAYRINTGKLREVVAGIDGNFLRLSSAAFADDRSELFSARQQAVLADIRDFWQRAQDSCKDKSDKLYVGLAEQLPLLIEVLERGDPTEIGPYLMERFTSYDVKMPSLGNGGKQENWDGQTAKEWRSEYNAFAVAVSECLFAPGDSALRRALAVAWPHLVEARAKRSRDGKLEYEDLLTLTLDLLKRDRDVRAYLHDQFRVLLVDEFQDTDPIQWEIIRLITADPDDPSARPLPGRLIVVGDPKQAIYSFRGADVDTYRLARDQFAPKGEGLGEILKLTTNFRTVAPVITKVNQVFATAINDRIAHQVNYEALLAAHDPQDAAPGRPYVVVRDPQRPEGEKGSDTYKSTEMEPRQLAYAISLAVAEQWKVTHKTPDRKRVYAEPAKFSDVTILYPARTGQAALLDALDDFGIPYRSADAGLVYGRPAISGLLAALTYASEGRSDLDLWLALKSPLFTCTDSDLAKYRADGGQWFYDEDHPEGRVSAALGVLDAAKSRATSHSPVELIDLLLEESHIFRTLPHTNRGIFEADCLRMVRAHAQDWQDQGGVGLYEYLQWVASIIEDASKTALPEPDDREDNAVRLMTVYQAKGLEFPIVALAGMSHGSGARDPRVGVVGADQVEFRLSTYRKSTGYTYWIENEYEPRQRAEQTRVMYVALTRARDHLIISMAGERIALTQKGETRKRPPYSELLYHALPREDADITDSPNSPEPFTLDARTPMPPLDSAWPRKLEDVRLRSKDKWVASPSDEGAEALGVSALTEPRDGDFTSAVMVDDSDLRRSRTDGTALGTAVHRALDVLIHEPDASSERVEEVCSTFAEEEGAIADLESVLAMTRAALGSDTLAIARASGRFWSEMYLAAPVTHGSVRVVDGLIDLAYEDADGIHIIDYKTDVSIGEHNLPHYRDQLSSYVEMTRRATRQERITASILHLSMNSADLIDVTPS